MKIRIKKPTIDNLVGPFEAAISEYSNWADLCNNAEKIANHFKGRHPNDIFRSEIEELLLATKRPEMTRRTGNLFYVWMQHMGYAAINPFQALPKVKKEFNPIEIELQA